MSSVERVLVLGCGFAGTAVARAARALGMHVTASVRSEARAARLRDEGFDVFAHPVLGPELVAARVDERTHVVVAFPPDGSTDEAVAPALERAATVAYVSSTGVYGDHRGLVDESTPVPPPNERAARILAAERVYLARGATVFRCPGIYGRDRGLHLRVLRGEHRIPGDGTRFLSRIHAVDLAAILLGASATGRRASGAAVYVAGDLEPARHIDVVRYLCETYGVPMPPSVPLESVHDTLRADRRVDATLARTAFGVTLSYPTYREGMAPAATGIAPRGR